MWKIATRSGFRFKGFDAFVWTNSKGCIINDVERTV